MDDASPTRNLRLAQARERAGYTSARAAAMRFGWPESTYRAHESGTRNFSLEDAVKYARAFETNANWLWNGTGSPGKLVSNSPNALLPNTTFRGDNVTQPSRKIPVLGRAGGRESGELIMDGQAVDTVPGLPGLDDVPNAYAVYVVGDSMEPRYRAGEVAYVNPSKPYRRNDYVVAQIDVGGVLHGFLKQFIAMTPTRLVLRQLNPDQELEFDRQAVRIIHRVVASAET